MHWCKGRESYLTSTPLVLDKPWCGVELLSTIFLPIHVHNWPCLCRYNVKVVNMSLSELHANDTDAVNAHMWGLCSSYINYI